MDRRRRVTQCPPHVELPEKSSGKKYFPRVEKMPTAKSQMDAARQDAQAAAERRYLGHPPSDLQLIQATMVVPGKHLFPRGLDDPSIFDHICVKHHVWITRKKPNVFDVHGEYIQDLHQALRDLHWCLSDMSVSTQNASSRFSVQISAGSHEDTRVIVDMNSRPTMPRARHLLRSTPSGIELYNQLRNDLISSMEPLRTSAGDLKMRICFGRLIVLRRMRGLDSREVSLSDFEKMVKYFTDNGGASLNIRMPDIQNADKVAKYLMDPAVGVFSSTTDAVRHRCTVVLKTISGQLTASSGPPSSQPTHLTELVMNKPEQRPRLDWVTVAPDMALDWSIHVTACQNTADMPSSLKSAMLSLELLPENGVDQRASLRPPRLLLKKGVHQDVQETMLKTSVVFPFQDTPYVVEVSISQVWPGMMVHSVPKTWWSMEFYGLSWDATMIDVTLGERGRNWGDGLRFLWPGPDNEGVEDRFRKFLGYIVQIQAAIGEVGL